VVVRLTSLADAVVAARALSPESGRVLLGLVGVPGSGKSTVAEALVTALGPASVVVPMQALPGGFAGWRRPTASRSAT